MNSYIDFLLLPDEYLPLLIREPRDIYTYRHVLKQLILSSFSINYLLDILIEAVKTRARFRTLDCLKVLRSVLKNNPFNVTLDGSTSSKLFYLFKMFVFHKNEHIRACANMLIWSQCLDEDELKWLIDNWDKSDHILNRVLRYPQRHTLIARWAETIYKQDLLPRRRSEVVALLIDNHIPKFVQEDNEVIIWAIYYSRISDDKKQRLLIERFTTESMEPLWEISLRLRYGNVIDFMRLSAQKRLVTHNEL